MPSLKRRDIDAVIGGNIRLARVQMRPRTSQGVLGTLLGCSFQQVQKYEKGRDTVSAPTLFRLSRITGQPIEAFFVGIALAESEGA